MRRLNILVFFFVLAVSPFASAMTPQEVELKERLPEVFARSAAHYKAIDKAAAPLARGVDAEGKLEWRVPHSYFPATGKLDMRSIYWWTSGHFPGSLWLLYAATGDRYFMDRGTWWMALLDPVRDYFGNHDTGFMMFCSYGTARRIMNTTEYDRILLDTSVALCRRYDPDMGLIRSWGDVDDKKDFLVIPDNMMNLEMLMWASKVRGGEKRFADIARSHADITMKNHFHADGAVYHVLDYDRKTKVVKGRMRGQGLSTDTAWSRGQAWAIYGYTMMFRETGDGKYLDFARKVADYAINHPNMPDDGIPYWDFGAPGEERDSSAAAVMASGLLELAGFVSGDKGSSYRAFAVKQLLALCGDEYFAKPGENGDWLLRHGVGHKPAGSEIDVPLDYGDYYFLEALLRFRDSL